MPDMAWAWLIPALSAIAFAVIVTVGRVLPRQGAFLAPLAALLGFALFWFVLIDLLGHESESFSIAWLEAGPAQLKWGMIIDPLSVIMLGMVTFVALGIQIYFLELHGRGPSLRLVLRRARAVRRGNAGAGAGGQPAVPLHRLGAGGDVLLPAHRLLVRAAPGGGGGEEGLRHHAHRGRGPAHRTAAAVQGDRHLRDLGHLRGGGWSVAGGHHRLGAAHLPGGNGEVGAVPAAHVAAGRDGGAQRPSAR